MGEGKFMARLIYQKDNGVGLITRGTGMGNWKED
jgi:hypothetical protein